MKGHFRSNIQLETLTVKVRRVSASELMWQDPRTRYAIEALLSPCSYYKRKLNIVRHEPYHT